MENFGKIMAVILVMVISPIISGFVFMKMWAWFVVPVFYQNPLRLVEAIGLMFLFNYVRMRRDKGGDDNGFVTKIVEASLYVIMASGFGLLFGWVIKSFM